MWHFHLHLLPRLPDDTLQGRILLRWDTTPAPREELDRLADDLRAALPRAPGPDRA